MVPFLRVSSHASWREVRARIMPIYFTCTLHHGSKRLHKMTPLSWRGPPHPPGISLITYHIQDCRESGLPQSIRAVQICNYALMLMTETNIMDAVYCHNCLGYNIVCFQAVVSAAMGAQGGGLGLVTRERSEGWIVKSVRFRRTNVVIYEIVSGAQWTLLIRAYLYLSTIDNLPGI